MTISVQTLLGIMPYAKARVARYIGPLNAAMEEFGIDTPIRQASFLAQVAHESVQLQFMQEIASGAAYDYREDLGNTKPKAIAVAELNGTTAGRWFKGHGPIQITGYDNHVACGDALGLDLVNNPALITQAENAFRSAGWFWTRHNLNAKADAGDQIGICKTVNGGENGLAERLAFYTVAKGLLE